MKFIIILLIFVGSTFCEIVDPQQVAIEDQRFVEIVSGISAVINQLIDSIKAALNDLADQTKNWIRNELAAYEKATASVIDSFNEYTRKVKAELEALVNEQIKPCLEGLPQKIKAVEEETKQALKVCRRNGWSNLQTIKDDVANYRAIKQEAVTGMTAFIQSCANESSFSEKIKCTVEASRNVSRTAGVLRENIANTTAIVSAKIRTTVSKTHDCCVGVLRNSQREIQEIMEEARQCLEDASSTETPIQPPTGNPTQSPTENPTQPPTQAATENPTAPTIPPAKSNAQ